MPPSKPRQQTQDLGPLQHLIPQANQDDYFNRPGLQQVERGDLHNNPMTKLSDALSSINRELQPTLTEAAVQATEEEAARAVQDYAANRETWNKLIRAGQVPLGASPHAARAVHRLVLSEQADAFQSQLFQAFNNSPEGATARDSNDPKAMQQFIDGQRNKYYSENLKNGETELFSSLDRNEVWQKKVDQTTSKLMSAHASYRVQRIEEELTETVAASTSQAIDNAFDQFDTYTSQATREATLREAGETIADKLYNQDHGAVKNGMTMQKGGDTIVDALVGRAIARQDRSVLDLIQHIKRPDGPPLAVVPAVQAKLLAAEEKITSLEIQHENHAWAQEQRPYQRASLLRQADEHKQQDQRWEQERATWADKDTSKAETEIYRSLTRRVYEGLNTSDSKRGVKIINEAIRSAQQVLPEKADSLMALVSAAHSRKNTVEDDKNTQAQFYLAMRRDPLGFREDQLAQSVLSGLLKPETMRTMYHDLDTLREHAGHPFLRQEEFKEMLHAVSKGSLTSPEDEFSAEGQLRSGNAIASLRDHASEWIRENPKGTMQGFRLAMRAKVEPIIEQANREFGSVREQERKKQEDIGLAELQKAMLAKEAQKQEASKDILNFAQQVEADKRQAELDRINRSSSQPRVNENELTKWLRGERTTSTDPNQPRMDGKTERFMDWLKGVKQPAQSPASNREAITAESFGSVTTEEQRRAILSATSAESRRQLLVQYLAAEFMQRGQSAQDLQREVDRFLSKLPK